MTFDPVKCMAGDQMEGDLVTRLRIWSEYEDGFINDRCGEAADRIEELEKALCRIWVLNQRGDKFKDEIDMVVSTAMDGKTND
jgi:hypothetical protein